MKIGTIATVAAFSFTNIVNSYASDNAALKRAENILQVEKISRQENLYQTTAKLIQDEETAFVFTVPRPYFKYELEEGVSTDKKYMITRIFDKKEDIPYSVTLYDNKINGVGDGDAVAVAIYLKNYIARRALRYDPTKIDEAWQLEKGHYHHDPLINFRIKLFKWIGEKVGGMLDKRISSTKEVFSDIYSNNPRKDAEKKLDELMSDLFGSYDKRIERCKVEDHIITPAAENIPSTIR